MTMTNASLRSQIVPVAEVTPLERQTMFAIFARHYDCVSFEKFIADLEEKDCVLMLRNGAASICGFSTQKILRITVRGLLIRAVFSGDTIVDRAYWGEQELGRCWCRYVWAAYAEEPNVPLYWFLISKGYRTYLYLPLFFECFYPNCHSATPGFEQRVLDALASARFPKDYDSRRGVVAFAQSQGQLKPHLAEIPARRRRDLHVQFFLARNPGYFMGHELACLAEISPSNMKLFAGRMLAASQIAQRLAQGAD
jgi:hypothetical protein